MSGLPFQLSPQVGTELFPHTTEAPPIMLTTIEEPQRIKDDQLDPRQGSVGNSYGMADDEISLALDITVTPTTSPISGNLLQAEALYAAQKLVEHAKTQIRGWYLGQKHNADLSGLVIVKTAGAFSWGHATYTKALQLSMLELSVSAAAINAELRGLHEDANYSKLNGKKIFSHLLAVQFGDGAT